MHRSVERVPSVQHRAGQVLLDTNQAVNMHINCSHLSLDHLTRHSFPADWNNSNCLKNTLFWKAQQVCCLPILSNEWLHLKQISKPGNAIYLGMHIPSWTYNWNNQIILWIWLRWLTRSYRMSSHISDLGSLLSCMTYSLSLWSDFSKSYFKFRRIEIQDWACRAEKKNHVMTISARLECVTEIHY